MMKVNWSLILLPFDLYQPAMKAHFGTFDNNQILNKFVLEDEEALQNLVIGG